jgi:hypothetical protein
MFESNIQPRSQFKAELEKRVLAASSVRPWWSSLTFRLAAPAFGFALLFLVFGTSLPTVVHTQVNNLALSWQLDHAPAGTHIEEHLLAEEQDLLNL